MTTLADQISAREFVVTTELTPPKGTDLADIFAKADSLRGCVDAFNLTESPRARMAIAPLAVARLLLERGIEPIVQITARDRNRIAIQADMLGGAVLGVRNFVFMAGDPPANGDHPEAKPVFDLNSNQMLRAGHELAQGRDMMGNPLRGAPRLFLGATANPGARDLEGEVTNTRRKIDAGAQFLQTQAVYERETLERFMNAVKPDGVAILAGIIPLKSAKMGAWLNANVPGIRVPDPLLQQMQSVAGTDREIQTGIGIAARTISEIRQLCSGVHVMALGWEAHIPAILQESGLKRPTG
ncbi:MAG TPA: methylenetetrahydrofolate reductase [Steroidobacteraceae bacterium]|nr:methylenetetrahydrofolate reductase [Steroidobacteraceae bacterium]